MEDPQSAYITRYLNHCLPTAPTPVVMATVCGSNRQQRGIVGLIRFFSPCDWQTGELPDLETEAEDRTSDWMYECTFKLTVVADMQLMIPKRCTNISLLYV